MKRIALSLSFLLCAFFSFAQFPNNASVSNAQTLYEVKGALLGGKSLMLPVIDTLSNPATIYKGALTLRPQDNLVYYSDGVYWHPLVTTNSGFVVDSIYVRFPLGVDTDSLGHQVIFIRASNGLVNGGIVSLDSCRRLQVTAAIFNLNFVQYASLATTVTVDVADAYDRIDLIVVDTFSVVSILKGTSSGIAPQANPSSQIALAQIPIAASATCVGISISVPYDENLQVAGGEFDTSRSGTIAVDFNGTVNPYHLTKAAFISTYSTGSQVIFTHTGAQDTVTSGELMKFFLYLNTSIFNSGNQIQIQFFLNSVAVSANTVINSFFNALDTGQYQNVSIPLSAFNFSSNIFNKIVFTFAGDDTGGAGGLYIDYIQLQKGSVNSVTQLTLTTNGSSGAATLINNVLNIPQYSGGGTYTAGNGITDSSSRFILGGTIYKNTTIDMEGNQLSLVNSLGGSFATLNLSGLDGYGAFSQVTSGSAFRGLTSSGLPMVLTTIPTSTATVIPVLYLERGTTNTAANGIGGSIDYGLETASGNFIIGNRLVSKWSDAIEASRTSEFSVIGLNSAVTNTLFTLSGNGQAKLDQYASNGFYVNDSTNNKPLVVNSSGVVSQGNWSGGGGSDGNGIYSGSGTLPGNVTVDADGNTITFANGNLAFDSPLSGASSDSMVTWNPTTKIFRVLNIGDIAGRITGSALTKTDDANVTLTLGGTPSLALLKATSLTLGWTGNLAATRGGTGTATVTTGDILYGSASNVWSKLPIGTTGQHLQVVGGLPVWRDTTAGGGGGISDITGLVTPGTNVYLNGSGTSGSPYVVNSRYESSDLIRSQQITGLPPVATLPSVITVAPSTAYNAWPTIIKDKVGKLQVYYINGTSHITFDHVLKQAISGNGGISWSTKTITTPGIEVIEVHAILMTNGNIGLVITTDSTDNLNHRVYFLESSDNGQTFSSPILVATTYAAGGGPICTDLFEDQGELYIVLYGKIGVSDTRTSTTIRKSSDYGVTWGSDIVVASTPGSINYNEGRIVRYADSLVIFIRDDTNDKLSRSVSTDYGATWGTLADVTPPNWIPGEPDPIVVGNMLQLFYRSELAGVGMSRAVSYNGGLVWSNSEVVENTSQGNGYEYSKTIFDNGLLITAYGMDITGITNAAVKIVTYRFLTTTGLDGAVFTPSITNAGNISTATLTSSTSTNTPLISGGTAANDDITIQGTTHATKATSYVNLQPQTGSGNVGIGTITPAKKLSIESSVVGDGLTISAPSTQLNLDGSGGTDANLVFQQSGASKWDLYNYVDNTFRLYNFATSADVLVMSDKNLGIGATVPTARLHLPAGTATAGTAPLKFTTGTALTTPADGAMEYHSSHLYFTIGSTRYQLDQTPLTFSTGLTNTASTITSNLSTGVSGGQSVYGGTAAAENLYLSSTISGAGKGKIIFGTSVYDEANNRLGILNASPTYPLDVSGVARVTGTTYLTGGLNLGTATGATGGLLYSSQAGDNGWSLNSSDNNSAYIAFSKSGSSKWAVVLERNAPAWGAASNDLAFYNYATSVPSLRLLPSGGITFQSTVTAAGTTGAQTINKPSGSVNFAAAAQTLVVTNSLVSTNSQVMVTVYGTDATAISARVTLAAGSFTITLNAAATAETKVGFWVIN